MHQISIGILSTCVLLKGMQKFTFHKVCHCAVCGVLFPGVCSGFLESTSSHVLVYMSVHVPVLAFDYWC